METKRRPKLAVFKFASCDGCQLTLLNCEDELLALADRVELANFLEASRATTRGPYDLTLVEGSITTPHDAKRILKIRKMSRKLVTIGACATSGGVQALRNFGSVEAFTAAVYAHPGYIKTLSTSTPIAHHVKVDFELNGCPVDKKQLLEVISAILAGRTPRLRNHSVCLQCKQAGNACVTVAQGIPCLGPITRAGCGGLCPSFCRGCFGCFGPAPHVTTSAFLEAVKVDAGKNHKG
jgi:sulfhydrogenase subunit delta